MQIWTLQHVSDECCTAHCSGVDAQSIISQILLEMSISHSPEPLHQVIDLVVPRRLHHHRTVISAAAQIVIAIRMQPCWLCSWAWLNLIPNVSPLAAAATDVCLVRTW